MKMLRLVMLLTCSLALISGNLAWADAKSAPGFTLKDSNGKDVSLSDYKGQIVVLEWTNPSCPFVKRHYASKTMTNLATKYAAKNVAWLAINSSKGASLADNKDWSNTKDIKFPVLDDHDGKVGKLYGAKTTPHMFIVDTAGKIAYEGAIDDDAYGEVKVNYVSQALDELLAGKAVSIPETKPYGCSVKYAD